MPLNPGASTFVPTFGAEVASPCDTQAVAPDSHETSTLQPLKDTMMTSLNLSSTQPDAMDVPVKSKTALNGIHGPGETQLITSENKVMKTVTANLQEIQLVSQTGERITTKQDMFLVDSCSDTVHPNLTKH
jgi:hypothetical protein